jgi:hypothetical protein
MVRVQSGTPSTAAITTSESTDGNSADGRCAAYSFDDPPTPKAIN